MGIKDDLDVVDYLEQCRDNANLTDAGILALVAKYIHERGLYTDFITFIEENIP